ncbi:transmembrane protein, putative (macronuclear) [Tetrahymena thermophila SB210]|uniref:Transmembrane protein, putative n=1 Tax=Tetrahymena thermophila (strain SB210) TaxID=312017 RepID=W7XEX5_TETTS|nr:transmembrane protein, putative [Tetrahymena thermophila SB210]EWS75308.1 transmembrane protein, putative [Tetrahymena thermophila SB210]|eukprot:XP_012652156.1 transmembrane protein, putative [Tetrahymena thermophila SB210]
MLYNNTYYFQFFQIFNLSSSFFAIIISRNLFLRRLIFQIQDTCFLLSIIMILYFCLDFYKKLKQITKKNWQEQIVLIKNYIQNQKIKKIKIQQKRKINHIKNIKSQQINYLSYIVLNSFLQ